MKIERDAAEVTGGIRPRAHARRPRSRFRSQNRDYANWQERMSPWAGRRGARRGAPAAAGPRRPRRRAEVQAVRTCANILERGVGRVRPPRAVAGGALWQRPSYGRSGVEVRLARRARSPRYAPPRAAGAARLPLADFDEGRRLAGALSRCRRDTIDGPRDRRPAPGATSRSAGVFEVQAFGASSPGWARTSPGEPAGSTGPPGDGDLLDPGRQGARRSAMRSRSPGCPAPRAPR